MFIARLRFGHGELKFNLVCVIHTLRKAHIA